MRLKNCFLFILLLLSIVNISEAQTCSALGQTPATAFPVCGTTSFTQTRVPICSGRTLQVNCTNNVYEDVNPFYYRFTCYTAGTLGFTIAPVNANDDYDWVLYDITNRNPSNIYTNRTWVISENWSGELGSTGASAAGTRNTNCAGGGIPRFNSMPNLVVGHEYLLMVSYFTASTFGYSLNFTGGTAVITDPLDPHLTTASINCDGTQATVRFNKKMRCSSLAANGSDFTVAGATIVSATGFGCTTAFDMDSVLLTFSAPLAPGTYNVVMATGSDGNTIQDNCAREIPLGESAAFTVTANAPLPMGTANAPASCIPSSITLQFAEPVRCNTLAANGSDFTISGPQAISITGATATCNASGETQSVTLQFNTPAAAAGSYQITMATGSDGNTLLGACSRSINAGESTSFTVAAQTPLPMGTANAPGNCTPSSITIQFPEAFLCNTLAANGSDFVITGPSAVTIAGATATCNGAGESQTVTLTFSAPVLTSGTYQIAIANGSDGNTLTGACNRSVTAGQTTSFTVAPQTPLPMGTADAPTDCIPSMITIQFPEAFLCNTLAANGSDFVVTGPETVTVTGATATCNGAGESQSVVLTFSGPVLTPGNYQIAMAVGSDGNTLTGACNRSVTAAQTTSFTVAPQPPLPMGTIPDPGCAPNSITITFTDPLLCASIATDGSDFQITGPSAVTITSATGNCNATTTSITIQLSGNILTSGIYNLIVNNGTDGNTLIGTCNRRVPAGSSVSFTIAPQPPLPAGTLAPVSCAPTTLTINLPEPVNCGSINVSDFQITGPAPVTITDITNVCTGPATTQTITLTLDAPVSTPGTYQLEFVTGTDGNTLVGPCMRTVPAGSTLNFTIPVVPPVQMNSIAPITCSPTSLRLIFDDNVRCASVAANGSDFLLNGPPGINITGASATCDAAGLTKEVNLQLSAPIVLGGNYSVQLTTGSDGNTILSECYRPTPAGTSVNFQAWDTVSARFTYTIAYDCEQDQLTFTHDGAHQVNNWSWQLNGATASTAASFTATLPASSTNTVALTVSNPGCTATHTEQIVLDNKVTAGFTIDPTACPDDSVSVVNTSTGPIDIWEWNFGNGMNSTQQQPRPVTYPLTGTEINYTVTLTVSNAAGCRASVSRPVQVLSSCLIAVPTGFTPNGDGLNDYFYPLNAFKADNLHFRVYNRWGQVVFESRDWTKKWDGRINGLLQPTGVYVWMLEYIHRDTRQKISQKGTTTLIR
ncbi:gliding motility-associated C-terminal domain-containing protein [Terrimonas ferruginea]|uniref:T9SS type B sorting domain-containing protein n=1 Tax=Terrimonas ferruginea TaxID=249 RepID=UPI0003F9977F|nr:gliding motility-associated C-terminal domain-containing protein [Terrimonas ferruginea]